MSEKEAIVLMLMSVGAFIIPFTSKRMMLPSSVGEIIFGMVIAYIVNVGDEPMQLVEYFSTFGFLVLMYIAGLELDFDKFRTLKKRDIWLYVLMYIPIGLSAFTFTNILGLHWSFILIFFTTGIGLLFTVLKETGLLKTDIGQSMLIIGMIGEIISLIGLTVVTKVYQAGVSLDIIFELIYILIFFILIYIILRVTKVILWWFPRLQSVFLKVGNPTETGIRANFLVLFCFVTLAAVLKIEFVVGAFLGGMMFALVFPDKAGVMDKLGGIGYGFFIPVFFISVGTKFTFSHIFDPDVIILALIISGVLFLVKLVGSITLFFTEIKNKSIILIATSLSFPLTILVAFSTILSSAGVITDQESSAIVLSAVFSAIVYPWLFRVFLPILLPELNTEE